MALNSGGSIVSVVISWIGGNWRATAYQLSGTETTMKLIAIPKTESLKPPRHVPGIVITVPASETAKERSPPMTATRSMRRAVEKSHQFERLPSPANAAIPAAIKEKMKPAAAVLDRAGESAFAEEWTEGVIKLSPFDGRLCQ